MHITALRGLSRRSLSPPSSQKTSLEGRVSRVSQGALSGLPASPTLQTAGASALVGALAAGALFLIVSTPPGWMVAAVAAGGVAVGAIGTAALQGRQRLEFEASCVSRLCKGKNYNQITDDLYLGALPNQLSGDGKKLKKEGIGAVLSVNEPWERDPMGLSVPYQKGDWKGLCINLHKLDVHDHKLLDNEALDQAADTIHGEIQAGNKVYVHCRAGVGRSAMAVAAYLVKYKGFSVEKARSLIKQQRPASTINKKVARLNQWNAQRVSVDG